MKREAAAGIRKSVFLESVAGAPNDRVVYASREAGTTIENEYYLLDDRRKIFKNSRVTKHTQRAPIICRIPRCRSEAQLIPIAERRHIVVSRAYEYVATGA